jgi:hypothetical protein
LWCALDNDTLDALEDGVTSIVLVNFLSPHAGQIRFGSQGMQKAMN